MKKSSGHPKKISKSQEKKRRKRLIVEIVTSVTILIVAIALTCLRKSLLIEFVYKTVRLEPNSIGFETWLNPPTTITRGYYLFNISNPVEIMKNPSTSPIIVNETQPYCYVLNATKQHVQWLANDKALRYSIYRVFNRDPVRFQESSINDTGTFVDILRAITRTQFQAKPSDAFFSIGGHHAFYHRNAVEQIEGFTSPLFYAMQDKMTGPNTKKYGFIYRYNGSRSYNYTIRAGLMEKGQVLSFASESLPFSFETSNAFKFTLYDGLTFVPMMFDKPSMNIFQADFCRPIRAQFNRVVSMFGGIDVHEYVIRLIDFENCADPSDIETCPEVDMLDISRCISSSLPANTVFLSKVHFYGSKTETMEKLNLKGLTPNREQHEALIYFDPYSGTPLRAHHRLQINIDAMIDPMRVVNNHGDLTPTGRRASKRVLPLVWIDQEVNVDSQTIRKIRLLHLAFRYGAFLIFAVALILIVIIVLIMEVVAKRAQNKKRINRAGSAKSNELVRK